MANAPAVVMVIAALVCAASAQQPVFRSRVELVTVDITVVDGDGNPVRDLAADRFEVSVDGSPRRIVWAEFVPHHTVPAAAPASADHFTTNEGANPGQVLLIAVDRAHIRRAEGRAALRGAANFVDALDRADRVAAIPLDYAGPINFTTEHPVVKGQLQRLSGEATDMPAHYTIGLSEAVAVADGSRIRLDQVVLRECGAPIGRLRDARRLAEAEAVLDPCPAQVEQEARAMAQHARTEAQRTLNALRALIRRLEEIEGPKTLVLLSEGLVAEPQLIDLSSLGTLAQSARVTIHVVQLDTPLLDASTEKISPTLLTDMQLHTDGLSRLAGTARGGLFRLVGDDPYPFRRILKELSGHYLVAFEAAEADRDGRVHRIGVNVRGRGLTIRSRPAFKVAAAASTPAADTELVRLLRNPRLATELPLRIAAYTFRDSTTENPHLVLSAETDAAPAGQEPTAGLILIDNRGIIAASGAGMAEGGKYFFAASVPAGRYTLRGAAITASGRRGSVERQLDVQLTAGGAGQLSDLMLSDAAASDALRPLVIRAGSDKLIAYLETYGADGWNPETVGVAVEVGRDDGPPVLSVPSVFKPLAAGRWALSSDVPLAGIPPGEYVLKVTLAPKDGPAIHRTRRFVIPAR